MKRSALAILLAFSAVPVGLRAQQGNPMDAMLEIPQLDAAVRITTPKRDATPIDRLLDELVKTAGLTIQKDETVPELTKAVSVDLTSAPLKTALDAILRANGIEFTVLAPKAIFVYSATPSNKEKFAWQLRTFPLTRANPMALTQILNKELTSTHGIRPIMLTEREPPTIRVRATAEKMALIAKLIADNDK